MHELVRNAQSQLQELCRRHNVRRLDLFGSATGEQFDPRTSDLDFLVEFGEFAKGEYANHYFALLEELQALFSRPVDLVVERAVRNPYMRESIERTRQLIYAA
jgi:predicted nucleotidyltransferase